jgi:uncharacterized oligopeptide transporter (OPT) family protein
MPRARGYFPSAMGLGLGLVIPFQNSLSFAIGALVAFIWTKISQENAEKYNVSVASGFVAGESLIAAVMAILCTVAKFLV